VSEVDSVLGDIVEERSVVRYQDEDLIGVRRKREDVFKVEEALEILSHRAHVSG